MKQVPAIVITGASAGLGRAIAREFGKSGARIGLLSRDRTALEATAREVEQLGGTAATYAADVSDDRAVEAAAAWFEERLGPLDVWVNNAMVSVFSPVKEMEAAEYRRVTEVNYLGYVHGTLAALRRMLPRDRGRIVQVGSALAVRSIPLQSAYCATKHAIIGFTDSLRSELYHDGSRIKVVVVQMPAMNTPQFTWARNRLPNVSQPVPPIFDPKVGAEMVLHAALTRFPRREYWVGGSTVKAIVGQKIIPGLLDRYLAKTGYQSQQSGKPASPDTPDNLSSPVPTTFAADGPYRQEAHSFSLEAELSKNRGWLLLALAIAGAIAGARKLAQMK